MSKHTMHPFTCRRRLVARRRSCPSSVRFTLLAPPSRLTPEEAAVLLRLPRRVVQSDFEWRVPGASEFGNPHPAILISASR